MLDVLRGKRHIHGVVEHAALHLVFTHGLEIEAKNFVEEGAFETARLTDADQIAVHLVCVLRECMVKVHDSLQLTDFFAREVFLSLIILDKHHRVERVIQVLAHHDFFDLWTALQYEVEERLATHAVVKLFLVLLRHANEVTVRDDFIKVALASKPHKDLVADNLVQLFALLSFEKVRLIFVTLVCFDSPAILAEFADALEESLVPLHCRLILAMLKSFFDDFVALVELLLSHIICLTNWVLVSFSSLSVLGHVLYYSKEYYNCLIS